MPEYRYSVIDAKGQSLSGTIEAENEDVCRRIIAQRGLYCLSVTPASLASRSLNIGGKPKLKPKELTVFCRQMAAMLNSGIGIIKSLDIMHVQTTRLQAKKIIKNVYDTVQRGQSFSAALRAQSGAFPDLLINMVEIGEASGTLDSIMERVANHFEKDLKTANKIKNAMIYPIILASLTVGVVILMMVFVLPTFMRMFASANAPLPGPTKLLIGLSNSLTGYWYIYIIVISTLMIVWMNYIKSEGGRLRWDRFKTRMPMVGKQNIIIISARFARTLSTLMQSGVPMLRSLEITSRVIGNKFFEKNITLVREDIRRGIPLSVSLKKHNLFPAMLLSMITIGEESGTLDGVLLKTASFYDEESDNAISRMVGMLEPLMIIVMAGVVGFIVISIILPIFGMMQHVG